MGECSGSGSGEGEGSGSGSSGEEEENQPPAVAATFFVQGDNLVFTGMVSDDGAVGGLTVHFGELIIHDVIVNPDGTFSFQVPCPQHDGTFSFSVTDDEGLASGTNYGNYTL
jgi:hypothetical protein